MPGVTISAGYGAGGSVVPPRVASLLGLPLLARAISSRVPAQLQVSAKEAEGGAARRSLPDRFISALVPLAAGVIATHTDTLPRDLIAPPGDGALFREQADAIIRAALVSGAVILLGGGAGGGGGCLSWTGPGRTTSAGSTRPTSTTRTCFTCTSTARLCRWTLSPT